MRKILISVLLFTACEIYIQEDYVEQYVVECFLIAGEQFPVLLLSTTASIEGKYDFNEQGVDNATVNIFELSESGDKIRQISYRQNSEPGHYLPVLYKQKVKPGRKYRLEIDGLPHPEAFITAETYVPHEFEIVELNHDTLAYQGAAQFEITMTRSYYPGRQNIYIFTTESLDPENYPLTPLYTHIPGPNDFYLISSPILHEENYQPNEDGTITIPLPWIMIAYLGPNRISVYAIDDNVYDFYRTADIQIGGFTQSPGEIENVIYNVEGGIGIFGSMAKVSANIYLLPRSSE